MATNQGFKSFIPDPKKLNEKFLYHWLRANRRYLDGLGNGATFKELSKAAVIRLELPLPPLEEQRRLVAILDAADELRAKRSQALALLSRITDSFFDETLASPESKNSPPRRLTDVFDFRTGKLDSNAAEPDGKYPFFTCSKDDFRIDKYAFDCEALLLAGNNASADYSVKHYKGKFNAYQRTYVLTLKDENNIYEYARIALERKLKDLKHASKGTNTKYLTMGIFNEQKIVIPPVSLQRRLAEQLRTVETLRRRCSQSLESISELFLNFQYRAFEGTL